MASPSPLVGRREVLAGLAAVLAAPGGGAFAQAGSWELGIQILAGTRPRDPTLLTLAIEGLAAERGRPVVDRLLDAVLRRDAADITEPFADAAVEAAARRLVEIVYTGEIPSGAAGRTPATGFHQALAWQVLPFTKAPSVCGPGFGWWTHPPDMS